MPKLKTWKTKAVVLLCLMAVFLKLQVSYLSGVHDSDPVSDTLQRKELQDDVKKSQHYPDNDRHLSSIKRLNRDQLQRDRKARFSVRLHLPDVEMSDVLKDKNSEQYEQLTRELTSDLQRLFEDTPGAQTVYNFNFSPYNNKDDNDDVNKIPTKIKSSSDPVDDLSEDTETDVAFSPLSTLSSLFESSSGEEAENFPEEAIDVEKLSLVSSTVGDPAELSQLSKTKLQSGLETKAPGGNVEESDKVEITTVTNTSKESSTDEKSGKFDLQRLTRLFKESFVTSGTRGEYDIILDQYVKAYLELMGIFQFLGTVFSWAGDDVRDKLGKFRAVMDKDIAKGNNHYETMKSMFEYENSPEGKKEGTKINHLIHRALKFISGILKALTEPSGDESMGTKAKQIYDDTLGPHHGWYIRMGVYVALLAFPSRDSVLPHMGVTDDPQGLQKLLDLASVVDAVYDEVEKLYVKYGI